MSRSASIRTAVALVLAACGGSGGAAAGPGQPGTLEPIRDVAAAESLLVDLHEVDPSIRIDARYRTAQNFTGAPLPGYEANRLFLRREAGAALGRVQARLRERGLGLEVWDAYRPVRATEAMVEWAERTDQEHLLDDGYIARRSRHNLGVAIDLTLVDLTTGREIDMGTPFDTFGPAAHTASASGDVAGNRAILVQAMEAEGFENYPQEWWHFSYPLEGAVPFDVPIQETTP